MADVQVFDGQMDAQIDRLSNNKGHLPSGEAFK